MLLLFAHVLANYLDSFGGFVEVEANDTSYVDVMVLSSLFEDRC